MRWNGTLVLLGAAAFVRLYAACSEARIDPLVDDAGAVEPEPSPEGEDDGAPPTDGAARDARADATRDSGDAGPSGDAGWPCPPPSAAPSTLNREWVTGPLPPVVPGASSYALTTSTVCDRVTLLEWERAATAALKTWDDAKAYCDSLTLGGANDWRLPTRIELLSLVDYGRAMPAIDPTAFPGTQSAYWTSTLMAGVFGDPNAYYVSFNSGVAAPYTKTEALAVRCVRGGR